LIAEHSNVSLKTIVAVQVGVIAEPDAILGIVVSGNPEVLADIERFLPLP